MAQEREDYEVAMKKLKDEVDKKILAYQAESLRRRQSMSSHFSQASQRSMRRLPSTKGSALRDLPRDSMGGSFKGAPSQFAPLKQVSSDNSEGKERQKLNLSMVESQLDKRSASKLENPKQGGFTEIEQIQEAMEKEETSPKKKNGGQSGNQHAQNQAEISKFESPLKIKKGRYGVPQISFVESCAKRQRNMKTNLSLVLQEHQVLASIRCKSNMDAIPSHPVA